MSERETSLLGVFAGDSCLSICPSGASPSASDDIETGLHLLLTSSDDPESALVLTLKFGNLDPEPELRLVAIEA